MAAFDTTRPVTTLSAGRFLRKAQDMMGVFATWNDTRLTRKALSKLTARELEDIGLTRADIANL